MTDELERRILEIKGEFFLSPRERLFLDFLKERKIPHEVILEGIEECYRELPPERRHRYPLFMCLRHVERARERLLIRESGRIGFNWKDRFMEKVRAVEGFLKEKPNVPESEEEAQELLRELEREILNELWDNLEEERKREIFKKFRKFRGEEELFKELVREELRAMFGIPVLSLYVD